MPMDVLHVDEKLHEQHGDDLKFYIFKVFERLDCSNKSTSKPRLSSSDKLQTLYCCCNTFPYVAVYFGVESGPVPVV